MFGVPGCRWTLYIKVDAQRSVNFSKAIHVVTIWPFSLITDPLQIIYQKGTGKNRLFSVPGNWTSFFYFFQYIDLNVNLCCLLVVASFGYICTGYRPYLVPIDTYTYCRGSLDNLGLHHNVLFWQFWIDFNKCILTCGMLGFLWPLTQGGSYLSAYPQRAVQPL